jgi:glucosamine-6-phosphate deaminase
VTIHVLPDSRRVARAAAERIAAALATRPTSVLGLPTGRTAAAVYRELVSLYAQGRVDFSQATTFNLDEFVGLPPGAPGSYRQFMDEVLFRHINLDAARIHFLDGTAADLEAECARYERAIAEAGGIDLMVLGVGTNGHVAFNEPGPTLTADTHRARLRASTRRANRALFGGHLSRVPHEGLTVGMATILHAGRLLVLATGRRKSRAVAGLVCGPLTTRLPASLLRLHRDIDVFVDEAAARALDEQARSLTSRPAGPPESPPD